MSAYSSCMYCELVIDYWLLDEVDNVSYKSTTNAVKAVCWEGYG